jgi:hypothetical protein
MGLHTLIRLATKYLKIGALSLSSSSPFLAFSVGPNCRQSAEPHLKEMESHHKRERVERVENTNERKERKKKEYKYSSLFSSVLHSPNICNGTYRLRDSSKSSSSSNV